MDYWIQNWCEYAGLRYLSINSIGAMPFWRLHAVLSYLWSHVKPAHVLIEPLNAQWRVEIAFTTEEQLGLKMVRSKDTLGVLMIDQMERPSPN